MVQRDRSTLVTVPLGASRLAEINPEQPRPFQVRSYNHLLRYPADLAAADKTSLSIDAIIVPTIRGVEQLRSAAELARQARCQLVTFYTGSIPDGLAPVLSRLAPGVVTPLALRPDARHYLLQSGEDIPQSLVPLPALDISKKRTLGLLIGRSCGWTRMLFLDDDIRALRAESLKSATALLAKYPVVGLQVRAYPDASVVGHARHKIGFRPEAFISGGSMLVDPQRLDGFFPPVYHEDWLCVINHLRRGEVAVGGTVRQLTYWPFRDTDRARREEFGDILANGLLWLVHARNRARTAVPVIADCDYWRQATKLHFWEDILRQRSWLLEDLIMRLRVRGPDELSPLESLKVAKQRLGELSAQEFVSFTEKWLGNLDLWRHQLAGLPRAGSVAKALAKLGLSDVVRTYKDDSGRDAR
jgi:hypothetical protein